MSTAMAIVAVIFLAIAIILGFAKNINTGIAAMALALVAGAIASIGDSDIISGFPTNTFIILLGVMFYFGIIQEIGGLHLLVRKIMVAVGGHVKLLPFVVLYLSMVISGIGVGPVPTISIMTLISVTMAMEIGLNPFIFMLMSSIGSVIGSCSPISLVGLIATDLMNGMGFYGGEWPFFINAIIGHSITAFILCCILKFFKMRPEKLVSGESLPSFTKKQVASLLSIVVFIVLVGVFKFHVGLSGLLLGLILCLLGFADDKTVVKNMPWSTLIMICGVNLLMEIVSLTGGIDILNNALISIMNRYTALPIMTLASGILSIFSTTSSVVVPTMLPTIPAIVEQFPAISSAQLVGAIVNGSYASSISPLSAGGGTALASFIALVGTGNNAEGKYFKKLLTFSIINLILMTLVGFLGNWIYLK